MVQKFLNSNCHLSKTSFQCHAFCKNRGDLCVIIKLDNYLKFKVLRANALWTVKNLKSIPSLVRFIGAKYL